ncbi:MAG: trehalase family glycosidase [Bacteroidota bacterium]
MITPLRLLRRDDKLTLGGGNRLLWAPAFPLFPDAPGIWDAAEYYNYELRPLFTWTLLRDDGNEVLLRPVSRSWDPSALTKTYDARLPQGSLAVTEEMCILPNDVAASGISLRLRGARTAKLHLVAWTAQENLPSGGTSRLTEAECANGVISFLKHIVPPSRPELTVAVTFGMNRNARSFVLQLSEGKFPLPRWALTPMGEKFRRGLPNTVHLTGVTDEGIVYAALHIPLTLSAGKPDAVSIGFAASPAAEQSRRALRDAMRAESPAMISTSSWRESFNGVPRFECSDPYIERYYWYRWYGLRLNTLAGDEGNYRSPVVCEGTGYFRAPISYSAPCHVLENRWRHDPSLARGSLMTFIDNQREDGGFPGYIDVNRRREEMFYHAHWGEALQGLHDLHPSVPFLREAYEGLSRYARYFDKHRDTEGSGLYTINNHYETGQEYMRRYTAVHPEADRDNWGQVFRLKGVDATVYLYVLKRALAAAARELHKPGEAELWDIEADRIRQAVRTIMWDPTEMMFFDVDPATGMRTMVKAAACFYPYMTDIVETGYLDGLKRHLLNPAEFWSPFPVPSTAMDDETFSAEPEWKGKRMNCPWNGRVWPMTNSHIAEALGRTAVRFNDTLLRRRTAEFIGKFIHMMSFDGEPERPNSFEHYNPLTGTPSVYRGVDDYQHSWVVNLIISYVCGIRPEPGGCLVDPFPFGLARVFIDDVRMRDRKLRVIIKGRKFSVWMDGRLQGSSSLGHPLRILFQ